MNTTSTAPIKPLTIEDIKKTADYIQKMKEKPLPTGLSWFTRFMGKLGWHREYEVIFIDKDKLRNFWKPF